MNTHKRGAMTTVSRRPWRRWSPQEVDTLRASWGEGRSIDHIAAELSRTPDAVETKMVDLGIRKLAKQRSALSGAGALIAAQEASRAAQTTETDRAVRLPSIMVTPLPPARTCQWLEGEALDRNFCGQRSAEGSSYCPGHHVRTHVPRAVEKVA